MLEIRKGDNNCEFLIGITLFMYLSVLYFILECMLFLKISIYGKGLAAVIASAVLCSAFLYIMAGRDRKKTVWIMAVCVLLFAVAVMIVGQYIDTSYDGNGYRKIMAGLVREGWNPVWQTPEAANGMLGVLPKKLGYFGNKSEWFWMDVYPKSAAIAGSAIYDITNNIETAKYITLLSMICVFCLYHYYLRRYLKAVPAILAGLCIALNPVSMTQMRSFYVDAFLGNIILMAVIFIMLYFEKNIRGGGQNAVSFCSLSTCVSSGL